MQSLPIRTALATCVLSAISAAQTYISPPQAVEVEGNSSSGITFTNPTTRTQQSDSNLIGKMTVIRSMAFRRSNSHSRTGATARQADVQIDMGSGVAAPTSTFDTNYKANTRTTVHAKKNVSLPDWTGNTTRPAPFDLVLPFSQPFINTGSDPVVWDVLVSNNTGGGSYYMDWLSTVPAITRGTQPTALGTGCTTGNGTFTLTTEYTADATNLMLGWKVSGAPSTTGAVPALGLSDPNVNIGWCSNLRTDALLLLPPVTTDQTGAGGTTLTVPWVPAAAGVMLYLQVGAAIPGGIAVSNGVSGTTPFAKGGGTTAALNIYRVFSSAGHGPTGSPATTASPVLFSQ